MRTLCGWRLQDAVSREEIKRLRQKQRETGMSECDYFLEECCCGAKGASCCPSFSSCCGEAAAAAAAANGSNSGGEEEEGGNGGNSGRDDCAFVQGRRHHINWPTLYNL